MGEAVTLEMVQEAQKRLQGVAQKTGLSFANSVSKIADCQVYLKMENLQRTGSFKLRGAYNKVASLTPEEREKGVIAASAGNHAQGVALAASAYGCQSTICMPKHAPLSKVAATRGYGANVVLYGDFFDEAAAKAVELTKEHGYTFVHPFNDPEVIAGQGTIGLEILERMPDADTVIVPIGGGGLISGIACAIKSLKPDCRVIGVQAENAPSMKKSLEENKMITLDSVSTIADGIAVKTPGDLTYAMCQKYVDEVVTVSEEEIAAAILVLLEKMKMVAEGAGATSVAAAMFGKVDMEGHKVVSVLSGGNIDVNLLSKIIDLGLIKTGRKAILNLNVIDKPGNLSRVIDLIASCNVNIISIEHNRSQPGILANQCRVGMVIETNSHEHIQEVLNLLEENGYQPHLVEKI